MVYDLGGKRALVTGASAGIGAELARQLAPRVGEIWLLARDAKRLDALAAELPIPAHVVPCDLANAEARATTIAELERANIDILVNNAGVGRSGPIAKNPWPKIETVLDVNITALTHLTWALVPGMLERGHGAVLNVGSTAGIRPIPHLNVYAATKAYVDHFSRALAWELRHTGVGISLLLPSTTATEFFDRGEIPLQRPNGFVDSAATVATAGVDAIARQRAVATPGWKVGLLARALRWLPSGIVNRASDSVFSENR